jgi:hypothetical protein
MKIAKSPESASLAVPLTDERLTWALSWARRGFHVFPCEPNGKAPTIKGWQEVATTDEATIRRWWADSPDANIGLALYKSGHAALDLDRKHGVDGVASLGELEFERGGLPETLEIETPSGGRHLIVRGRLASRTKLRPGLDVRGEGALVVAAGSAIAGKPYRIVKDLPPAACPDWFVALAGEARERDRGARVQLVEPDLPWNVAAFESFLRARPPAAEGTRNDTAAKLIAGRANDLGVSAETATALAAEHWNARNEPPLEAEELKLAIRSGMTSAENDFGARASPLDPWSGLDLSNVVCLASHREKAEIPEDVPDVRDEEGDLAEWGWLRAADYVREVAHPEPLVDGLLFRVGVAMLVGAPDLGKTAVALDLGLAVAAGDETWQGRTLYAGGPVVYLACEGAPALTQRLEAWARRHGRDLPHDFIGVPEGEHLASEEARARLTRRLGKVRPAVVFIDTLSSATPGMKENDQDQATALMSYARGLHQATGALVVFLHHPPKSDATDARGSGAFLGNGDGMLILKDAGGGRLRLYSRKLRYDAKDGGLLLRLEKIDLGEDLRHPGRRLSGLVVLQADAASPEEALRDEVTVVMRAKGVTTVRLPELVAELRRRDEERGANVRATRTLERHIPRAVGEAWTPTTAFAELRRVRDLDRKGAPWSVEFREALPDGVDL